MLFEQEGVGPPLFGAIAWSSHKQSKFSYSSYGAEILDASDSDDRGFMLK